MINTFLIEYNNIYEIQEYFNDYKVLNNNCKYNYDFINLLNENDFIKKINININENENENENENINNKFYDIIKLHFNITDFKNHCFNTFIIDSNNDYIYYIIYDELNRDIKYKNNLGFLLTKFYYLIYGNSLLLKFSKLKDIYVDFTINDLANLISNNYMVYYIFYNKNDNTIFKKLGFNYSDLYYNYKYDIVKYKNVQYFIYLNDNYYNIFIINKSLDIFQGVDNLNNLKLIPNSFNIFTDFITTDLNLINEIIN